MPEVPYLDQKTESRLSDALTKVSACVADGISATDALVKVAKDANLGRGQTELLARAYNTGRTLYQLDAGSNLHEKLAEFPLADAEEAIRQLFPETVKTASQQRHDETISSDYAASPVSWLSRIDQLTNAERHAAVLTAARAERQLTKAAATYDAHAATATRDAMLAAKRDADLANQAMIAAKYAAAEAVNQLTDYFRLATSVPLAAVRENAAVLYGKRASHVLEMIADENPQFAKRAAVSHPVDQKHAPYSLLEDCLAKAAAFAAAGRDYQQKQAAAKEAREVLYRPFDCRGPQPPSAWDLAHSNQAEPAGVKSAAVASPAMWGGIGTGASIALKDLTTQVMPNKETIVKQHMGKLQDPAHEQELRQIRTQTMLADMLQNDPVISGYTQDDVLDAYTRLSEVAPSAVGHKLLAQALVRKYLEQGNQLETFDMDQLIGIENKLRPSPVATQPQPAGAR